MLDRVARRVRDKVLSVCTFGVKVGGLGLAFLLLLWHLGLDDVRVPGFVFEGWGLGFEV